MIRLPFIIQKMHNENKSVQSCFKHHNSKLTMQELQNSKGFNNVFFLGLLYHLKQNIDHGSPRWKNKMKIMSQN
jgi:hypothetical protein